MALGPPPTANEGLMVSRIDIAPGVTWWPRNLDEHAQRTLLACVLEAERAVPFYRPRMPRSGNAFSVEETNLGQLGWYSDESGYRYETHHPYTNQPWPPMPEALLRIWETLTACEAQPECCLVNLYRAGARMGLHQDRDELELDAPVLSISLGDDAVFRIGGTTRRAESRSFTLRSGDIVVFGGTARLAFHGIDRIIAGSSSLVPGGGRINLTLRRVTSYSGGGRQHKDARPGG
jgi:alkylated DNA repair protein (DNA oxidative demethylase)